MSRIGLGLATTFTMLGSLGLAQQAPAEIHDSGDGRASPNRGALTDKARDIVGFLLRQKNTQ